MISIILFKMISIILFKAIIVIYNSCHPPKVSTRDTIMLRLHLQSMVKEVYVSLYVVQEDSRADGDP